MIPRNYRISILGASFILALFSSPSAAEEASLIALSQERNGDYIKINVSLSSPVDYKVSFKPTEVIATLSDGSQARDWGWHNFFPGATAILKAGDSVEIKGKAEVGKPTTLSRIVLKEGSEAMIEILLKSGSAQKAGLYFKAPKKSQAETLNLGPLNAQVPQKK